MIVGLLTTCHTQYTWDRSICIFLFNGTKLQVFVTYLTGALYVHPLWFYKHQHDDWFRSKLFVACQRWWFQWRFAAILVNCAPSGEIHNYCTPHIIKENYENFLIHRCNYILLSQVYCVWQFVKTPTVTFNNPVLYRVFNLQVDRQLSREYFTSDAIYNGSAGMTLYYYMCRSWQDCCSRGENRSWPSVSTESVDSECWCLNSAIFYAFIVRLTVEERVFILESYLKTMCYAHCRQKFMKNLEGKRQ